jgi:hypothetical protein
MLARGHELVNINSLIFLLEIHEYFLARNTRTCYY